MHVVFFVESYYHKPLMNGICVKKVADKLVENGHEVTIFTSSENVYDLPSKEVVDGVHVYRIRRDLRTFLRLFLESHSNKPYRFLKLFQNCYHLWVHFIHSKCWPLKSVFTPLRYYLVAKKKLKAKQVDVIVGTYFHIEEVLAAILLKKKYKKAKLITYTLDAMTGRVAPKILGKEEYARKSIQKWEEYVFGLSDKICVMESHRAHYQSGLYTKEILDKIRYVDVPLLDLRELHQNLANMSTKKRIVYAGTSSRTTGSAKYLIELIEHIEEAELHLYGTIDYEIQQTIVKSGLENIRVFFHGYVDHQIVQRALQEADFLATFGSQNACMVSGKVFEYMALKKPIIAFYQIEDDVNIVNLRKYPEVLIIKDSLQHFQEDLEELQRFIHKAKFDMIDDAYLRRVFFKSTPDAMVSEIID